MSIDTTETERHGDFLVAGVAHRGTDVDESALWRELDDYEDDLRDAAVGDDRFAVMFDVDQDSGEFTYVAGREVGSADDLSPELTVVEIPDAIYAVFEAEAETVDEMVARIHEEELHHDDADDSVNSPVFERFGTGERPTEGAHREIYVPVREV